MAWGNRDVSRTGQPGELRQLVTDMERAIKAIGAPHPREREAFLAFQGKQFDELIALEARWHEAVVKGRHAGRVYRAFLTYVDECLSSTLSARSYFRERQGRRLDALGAAVKRGDWEGLMKYRVNHRFIKWAMTLGVLGRSFERLYTKMVKLRHEMVILLMPLAISQARVFQARTPRAHLSLTDLVAITVGGHAVGVDKFCPPFSISYRSMVMGRAGGDLIEQNSATLLGFSPKEQKILYRANKLVGRASTAGLEEHDYGRLADRLNEDAVEEAARRAAEGGDGRVEFRVTAPEVASVMAAASHVSADAPATAPRKAIVRMVAPEDQAPDRRAEASEVRDRVRAALSGLRMVERKLLVLKGLVETVEG